LTDSSTVSSSHDLVRSPIGRELNGGALNNGRTSFGSRRRPATSRALYANHVAQA
jgi:hypothetical protein